MGKKPATIKLEVTGAQLRAANLSEEKPDLTIEYELKPEVTANDIKNWFIWESAKIRKGESYPSLIYIAFLDFLATNKHITAKEALKHKSAMGEVIKRRRRQLGLNTVQLAQVARITQPQVGKLEKGQASISAYGAMFLALESYALFKGVKDAISNIEHMMSNKPNVKRGASVAA